MDVYKECLNNLTEEEAFCAEMCESIIAYYGGLGGYADKQYLTQYRVSLGDKRVEEIYHTLNNYIYDNYEVRYVGDGYNALVKKEAC